MATPGQPPSSSHHSEPRPSTRSQSTHRPSTPSQRRPTRTLPAWIDSYETRYGTPTENQIRALASPPPRALPAHHNHSPSHAQRRVSKDGFVYENPAVLGLEGARTSRARLRKLLKRGDGSERGRKWDHLRTAEPVIVPRFSRATPDSPWHSYVLSSRYGRLPNEEAEIVDPEMLDKMQPDFNTPVEIRDANGTTGRKQTRRKVLYKRLWQIILRHPLVPLAFRLTVLLTSIVALAISARIFEIEHQEEENDRSSELAQAIVAIAVDSVAIPYIGYMTWDEYTGKPLGLRAANQKIALVLMDLFFIIFKSASTALAFEALVYHNSADRQTRQYSQALAAFQMIGLIAWSFTLSVSVFRLVQKLGGGDDDK